MVNIGLTFQEQSWVPSAQKGVQLVIVPTARVDNHAEATIIEEHKVFFNPWVIALMFVQESDLQNTWDLHSAVRVNTHNDNQGKHDALVVPTSNLNKADINHCISEYVTTGQNQVPHGTFEELCEQGKLFKDILRRVILPAQFEAATPSKCEIICMWIEGLKNATAYITINRQYQPRTKIDCSFAYPGMTAGVCWSAQLSSPTTAILCVSFEEGDE